MKHLRIYTLLIYITAALAVSAQERIVQNRPYTDLRPLHLGIVVGTHLQDMELNNVGTQTITLQNGMETDSYVSCDQNNWDLGFNVGVLAEARLNEYFAVRIAPQLYFGTRNLTFRNLLKKDTDGSPHEEQQTMRSVYVGTDLDLIYAAKRFNNHRPYLMAGVAPMINISNRSNDYVMMKKSEVFMEVGMGCDFYLPFFKLRPELKFMYGLTNCIDKSHIKNTHDDLMLPYTSSVNKGTSKMIVLSFYFE